MVLSPLAHWLTTLGPRTDARRPRRRPFRRWGARRLAVLVLEDRVVPSTFQWNTDGGGNWTDSANWTKLSDSGNGSTFPNAVDDVAILANNAGANTAFNRTVTIPAATTVTVGALNF